MNVIECAHACGTTRAYFIVLRAFGVFVVFYAPVAFDVHVLLFALNSHLSVSLLHSSSFSVIHFFFSHVPSELSESLTHSQVSWCASSVHASSESSVLHATTSDAGWITSGAAVCTLFCVFCYMGDLRFDLRVIENCMFIRECYRVCACMWYYACLFYCASCIWRVCRVLRTCCL